MREPFVLEKQQDSTKAFFELDSLPLNPASDEPI